MYADKTVTKIADLPTEKEYWVILEESTYTIPAWDKHDRESTGTYLQYGIYLTKEKLILAIKDRLEPKAFSTSSEKRFKVIHVQPLQVNMNLSVEVSLAPARRRLGSDEN